MPVSTITRSDSPRAGDIVAPMPGNEVQSFGLARHRSLGLEATAAVASIDDLNQLLADTLTLRDLCKKHHWQATGPTFYMLHQLFDKLANRQAETADAIAERVQTLGGVAIAMGTDVAEATLIPRPPKDREDTTAQIARLIHALEVVLLEARTMARGAAARGDDGTGDLIISDIIRPNELHAWFLTEHLSKCSCAQPSKS